MAFDFYDDWEQDEAEWGNDELDRLLTGNDTQQPGKHGGMSYGGLGMGRGKGAATKDRGEEDSNVVPQSSMFGFLERLPWKIGGRGTRYRPGAADLQENVGRRGVEAQPLIGDDDDTGRGRHGRSRSDTVNSRSTTNSLSSRGDLFPSEDEDDAVPLDDEFAMVLERRTTTTSDRSSRRKSGKRPSGSRKSTKSASSKETRRTRKEARSTSTSSRKETELVGRPEDDPPSMVDLRHEEERLRREEEAQLEERRQAAHKLAFERGLREDEPESKAETPVLSLSEEEPPVDPASEVPASPLESKVSEQALSPVRDPSPKRYPPD